MNRLARAAAITVAGASLLGILTPSVDAQSSASIQRNGVHFGNGVVIEDRWVLTSAVLGDAVLNPLFNWTIEAGTCVLPGTAVGIKNAYLYNPLLPPFLDDVALLELASPLMLGGAIQKATIASPVSDYSGQNATMAGWWRQCPSLSIDPACITQSMPVITNTQAQSYYGNQIYPQHLALFDGLNTISPGGSGTGVYVGNELVAIASWGANLPSGCSNPSFPFVCTRMTQDFIDWIECRTKAGGGDCGAHGCSPCGCPTSLSTYGGLPDVTNGNLNFGFEIEDAPESLPGTSITGLFLAVGPLSLVAPLPSSCGSVYLPPGFMTWPSSGSPTGSGSCGWSRNYSVPLPNSL